MRKLIALMAAIMICALFCGMAMAEEIAPVSGTVVKGDVPSQPFSWQQLATIAGATTATLLIVQLLKLPLDKVWKIPTRIVTYLIAVIILIVATAFTSGLNWSDAGLAIINAVIVALAAMGAYEVTFARADARRNTSAVEE